MNPEVNFKRVCLYRQTVFRRYYERVLLKKTETKIDLATSYKNYMGKDAILNTQKKLADYLITNRDIQITN